VARPMKGMEELWVSEQNLNSRQMYDSAVEPYNGQINTKLCNDELNHKRKKKERRRNL
jgi:hypothetical protein